MPTAAERRERGITRRGFLKTAVHGAAAMGALSLIGPIRQAHGEPHVFGDSSARKPNIVYIFPDQHRNCSWSLNDPQMKTPSLQTFAAQSTVFNHCFSNYPLCSPHRACMLTGRFPQSNGVTANVGGRSDRGLAPSEITIGTVLKNAGYATGYVGKWHLYDGGTEVLVPPGPDRHGFDYWRACFNFRDRYNTKYYDDAGKVIANTGYAPTWQMDLTLQFIEQHAHEPFCVFLSWHPPHPPYAQAPKQFTDLYTPNQLDIRANVPANLKNQKLFNKQVEYYGHVSAEDAEMGRLMQKLEELGIADNTIVCFTSDHGDMLGSFGRWGKNVPWEESINVPFIVRWPGMIPAGKRLDSLFSSVDITPTLLGLAGVPAPPQTQGTNFAPILLGRQTNGPDSVFIMSDTASLTARPLGPDEAGDEEGSNIAGGRKGKAGKAGSWRGVRTAQFTYAKDGSVGGLKPCLLYNNQADPHQLRNLASKPAFAKIQSDMEAALTPWLKKVGEA